MAPDALINSLLEEGKQKKEEILAHAREEASRIIEDARLRVQEAHGRSLDLFRRKMEYAASKKLNTGRGEARRMVEEAKATVIQQTFDDLAGRLDALRASPGYGPILAALLDEALDGLSGDWVVKAEEREVALFRDMDISYGRGMLTFEASSEMGGGLELTSGDGRITIRNTFGSRMAKAKDLLLEETGKRMLRDVQS